MRLRSRKFWVATITALAMLVSELAGIDLDPEEVAAILLPVVAYLLGQSWVDARQNGSGGGT